MLGATLIGDQVIQMGQSCQTRLLTAAWMMALLHRKELPRDGVLGLIQPLNLSDFVEDQNGLYTSQILLS
jgi:hypothetical protein